MDGIEITIRGSSPLEALAKIGAFGMHCLANEDVCAAATRIFNEAAKKEKAAQLEAAKTPGAAPIPTMGAAGAPSTATPAAPTAATAPISTPATPAPTATPSPVTAPATPVTPVTPAPATAPILSQSALPGQMAIASPSNASVAPTAAPTFTLDDITRGRGLHRSPPGEAGGTQRAVPAVRDHDARGAASRSDGAVCDGHARFGGEYLMPTPEIHALLGASDSASWLNCPQYLAMKKALPDTTSPYAEAGRLAHAIAEYKARSYFLDPVGKRTYNAQLKKFKNDPAYDSAMEDATELYLETLKEQALRFRSKPFIALEVRVDYSEFAPEGFGTADCVMIGEDRIHVFDYKNGAGVPVSAEYNSQMMLYALGALQTFRAIYGDTIKTAHLTIVQPHAGGVKEWETSVAELTGWGRNTVAPAAQRALEGTGEAAPGAYCRFCKGQAQCRARIKEVLDQGKYAGAVPAGVSNSDTAQGLLLSDAEVGEALQKRERLVETYNGLKDYALSACLDGKTIPGFKAVEGRSSRNWTDVDAAFATLQERGMNEAILWERKPVSVAGLEKIVGKKA